MVPPVCSDCRRSLVSRVVSRDHGIFRSRVIVAAIRRGETIGGAVLRHTVDGHGLDAGGRLSRCSRVAHGEGVRAGLSIERLKRLNPGYGPESLHCHISDQDVIDRAKLEGHTRALCSAEKARPMLDGAIVLIGNAPLALARIARYALEEGVRPALVVGMPVGFVNVVESKELLAQCDVPQIVLEGRRGGSALAVTTLHAVMESA